MPVKQVVFSDEARESLARGVETLAKAVGVTLGPKGRHVLLDRNFDAPLSTKDGVTVAKEVSLPDQLENLAAESMKLAAGRASELAGDGTTTATILGHALLKEGHRLAAAGYEPLALKRGLIKAASAVIAELAKLSRPVKTQEDIEAVAFVAGNRDEELAKLIGDAAFRVGPDGAIAIEEAQRFETRVETVIGMEIEKGWFSQHFAQPAGSTEVVLENPLILIFDDDLETANDVAPILELALAKKRSLFVIANEIKPPAVAVMTHNSIKGIVPCVASKAPQLHDRRKEILDDIAAYTGAFVFGRGAGIATSEIRVADLGGAARVTVTKSTSVINGGKGKKADIALRVKRIRDTLASPYLDEHNRELLEERLARLKGGVSVLWIGGRTEVDMKERAARAEDATCAVRAAWAEGLVPGGGVALVRAQRALDDLKLPPEEAPAIDAMRRALEAPARLIAQNAGAEPAIIIDRIKSGKRNEGFNAASGVFEDLVKARVLDPTRVVRLALQAGVSIATIMLTVEVVIADSPDQPAEKTYLDPPTPDAYK